MSDLLQVTKAGLYCELGDFYIDPYVPVNRAIVSHAHSDHARWGCDSYLAASSSERLLRMRMQEDAEFTFLAFGQSIDLGGVRISLHPAGHILGSAQIRLEHRGRVEVVTGDYKLGDDPTCESWQPIQCHRLITESTFGLPVYRWPEQSKTAAQINEWWRAAKQEGKCCVLYGYAIGKSQRLLASLDHSIGPIFTHGAVEKGCQAYRQSGIKLPCTSYVGDVEQGTDFRGAMVIAVPSAHGTAWLRRFGRITTAMASGWMMIRGSRRRRSVDRGFVVSDHVDWPSLLDAVRECGAESIWVTHGYTASVARYLSELGYDAMPIQQHGRGENDEDETANLAGVS